MWCEQEIGGAVEESGDEGLGTDKDEVRMAAAESSAKDENCP